MNALIYSIHFEDCITETLVFKELLLSLNSLEKVKSNVKVKLYVSPSNFAKDIAKHLSYSNLEIIGFNAVEDKRLINYPFVKKICHKWVTAFEALKDFDNVIMTDPDVIFYNDPELLFNKYGNKNTIFAKPDSWDSFINFIGESGSLLNDGFVLIPKSMLNLGAELIKYKDDFVVNLANKYKNELNKEDDYWKYGIFWVSYQYGVYKYLKEINKDIQYFDLLDVSFYKEYDDLTDEERKKITAYHYTSLYAHKFLT